MQRFVIIGPTRAGTTLLARTLDYHKQINCDQEALKRYSENVCYHDTLREWFEDFYLKKINKAVGFKMLYEHLERLLKKQLQVEKIFKEFSIKTIHITRKSLLKQFVSFYFALTTKKWGDIPYPNIEQGGKFSLPIEGYDSLSGKIAQWLRQEKQTRKFLTSNNLPHCEIFYEDLSESNQDTYSQILTFLDVDIKPFKAKTKKQFIWDYKDVITNYFELLEWMQKYYPERM